MLLWIICPDDPENADKIDPLIVKVGQGDNDAFARLYEIMKPGVYGLALSMLKNSHDAMDVMQDTFVRVYRSAGSYVPKGKGKSWILTITAHLAQDTLRRYKMQYDAAEEDWMAYVEDRENVSPFEKALIRECMERLQDEEREIILLHAVSGLKHREIAAILKMELPTVLSKYHRGIQKLRKFYKEGSS